MSTHTTATARPDTNEMRIVHRVFRREIGNIPGLVRNVPPGDTSRAARIVAHFTEVNEGLHHHHSLEDEMLWPKLLERDTPDAALVLRMEEQHERVAALIERSQTLADAFATTADRVVGAQFADVVDAMSAALNEHLDDEETHILPIVERHITAEEWNAMADRGRASMKKDRLLVQLGWILLNCSPEEKAAFMSEAPLPARLLWRLVGRRMWAKEAEEIYGAVPAAA